MRKIGIGLLTCALLGLLFAEVNSQEQEEPAEQAAPILLTPPAAPPSEVQKPARPENPTPRTRRARPDRGDDFLTNEQIDRLMTFTERNFKDVHERLDWARRTNPQVFRQMIHRVARFALPIMRMQNEDSEIARQMIAEHAAQMAIEDLAQQYRAASSSGRREQIRANLRRQTELKINARLKRLQLEVKNLQRRLDEARQSLAEQEQNKQKLIDDSVADLTSGKGI